MNGKAPTFPLSSKTRVEPNPPLPFAPTLDFAESYVQENRVLMEAETADALGVAAWEETECAFRNRGGVCR